MHFDFPYDLSAPTIFAGAQLSADGAGWAIQLETAPWAYGCAFPATQAYATACVAEFEVVVGQGPVYLTALPTMERYCFDEVHIARRGLQRVKLNVPPFADRGALVIRGSGVSRLRIRAVGVEERQPAAGEAEEMAAIEGLLSSAARLDAPGELLRTRARGVVRAMLAPPLAKVGLAVVGLEDADCSDWLRAVGDRQLAELAAAMTIEATAPQFPGWCFDWAVRQPEPRWQLRTAVWRAMRDRCSTVSIDLPWLAGATARMPLGSDLSLPLFTLGQYEPNIFRLLLPMMRRGDVFVDVGANEGLYALVAAASVGPSGLVVAVEPSPRELERLRRNIATNGFSDRVAIVDRALSSVGGWANFAMAEAVHGGQNAFADQFSPRIGLSEMRTAATLSLDMLVSRLPSSPDFVKIDVEGAEFDVISGGLWTLEEARPIWLIEVGRTDSAADLRVVRRLLDADYRVVVVDDALGDPVVPTDREAWARVENVIAVPAEKLASRWPDSPARLGQVRGLVV